MELAAVTEASSSHVTKKCMTSSSASLGEPFPITVYAENPSSTRSEADQRRGYVRGGEDWRKKLTYSFGSYGNARLTTSLASIWRR